MKALRGILVLAILTQSIGAICQPENWIWRTYKKRDGLSSPHITSFTEDHHGFIWIGTDAGLNRFDGTHFAVFMADESDSTALRNGRIQTLSTDESNNILIGTYSGISVFDYTTGRFQSHKFNFEGFDETEQNFIRGFVSWKDGHTWIATLACVIDWDRKTNKFEVLDSTFKVTKYGFGNPFLRDDDGMGCWIASPTGMKYYNRKDGTIRGLEHVDKNASNSSNERKLNAYAKDKKGRIWYSTYLEGAIYCYDPFSGSLQAFPHRYDGIHKEDLKYSNSIILWDSYDNFWFSSWDGVIGTISFEDSTYRFLSIDNDDPLRIPYPMSNAFFETSKGDIWIGTKLGASVHSRTMDVVHPITIPESFQRNEHAKIHNHSIESGNNHNDFFLGSSEGLFWYQWQNRKFTNYSIGTWGKPENEIISLMWVGKELWLGSRNGLWSFNPITESIKKLDIMDDEFATTSIYGMVQIGEKIWFSCRYANLYSYNKLDGTFQKYTPETVGIESFPSTYYPFICADPYGKIWMASDMGIVVVDPSKDSFQLVQFYEGENKYGKTTVNGFVNSGEYMWITTSGVGVFKIHCKTLELTRIEGRNNPGKRLDWALCSDESGNVWFGSNHGLSTFDIKTNTYKDFRLDQPFASGEVHSFGKVFPNGIVAVLSAFEMLLIDAVVKKELDSLASPIISQVTSTDTTALFLSGDITLSSDRNHFTFYFSSPSAAGYSNIQYQYKVDGIDNEWVDAGNKTFATYGNLAGGRYVIRVRARSADGPWNEIKKPLVVQIEKKYFETLWFKICIAFILILMLWWLVNRRRKMELANDRQIALKRIVEHEGIVEAKEICQELALIAVANLRYSWSQVYFFDENEKCILAGSSHIVDSKTPLIDAPQTISEGKDFDIESRITQIKNQNKHLINLELVPLIHEKQFLGWLYCGDHRNKKSHNLDLDTLNDVSAIAAGKLAAVRSDLQVKKKEELLAGINSLLSESQLVSLRAQMNPHFVFNCLNSIQESIVMKHYAEASLYLNKFSKLFRLILQNSSKSLITMDEEINVLTLYLELEHMRFQKSFDYSIECDEELDISDIKIPSMLIQPFVENALWHGLMHKTEDRKLNIRFYPKDSEVFICEVEDNGIGRKKAGEIKAQKTRTHSHESKGIGISTDRLRLIGIQQGKQASVRFEDLYDENGNAAGTKVIFELSLYLN